MVRILQIAWPNNPDGAKTKTTGYAFKAWGLQCANKLGLGADTANHYWSQFLANFGSVRCKTYAFVQAKMAFSLFLIEKGPRNTIERHKTIR